ncbi:coatomer zeta subunit [Angomonas deanei]|nr:coatomer zeta subunit [Angomonas deanei]|eukprot:EPY40819.1 coatomer zeta subunit [Angomonas deanei]
MSRASNNWQDGNVLILDGHSVIFQLSEDIAFIVVGDCRDNELVLLTVLKTLVDSLREVLGTQMIGSREILEEYQALLLTVDELLDEGIVLETNSYSVAAEVSPYLADTGSEMTRKALSTVNKYLRENL